MAAGERHTRPMGYDEALAERVRSLLEGEAGVSERAMFGGLAFMVDGHLSVAVGKHADLMLRPDLATEERLLEADGVEQTVMRGRPMGGWLDASAEAVRDDAALAEMVAACVAHARTLPPKRR